MTKYNLGDIVKIKYGKDHKQLNDGNIPVYGTGGIMRYADTELYSKKSVLIPRKGSLGNLFLVTEPFWTVDTLFYTEINESIVIPEFLFYKLKTYDLASLNVGSAVPSLTTAILNALEVEIPSLEMQSKIIGVLQAFDFKIENNKKINHHLEQMAITIFESMFTNVSSGQTTIGKYVIPKRGKNLLSKDAISGRVPVVAGGLQPSTFHNIANTEHPVLTISASGANAGYVNLWHVPVWASDSSYIDSKMTDNVYFWYVMLKRRQQEIYDSQTGSAQPHIYPKHIEIMPTIELSKKEINLFTKRVTPLFKTVGNNLEEIKNLQNLRESLLPKILSGEISINQATK